MNEIEQIKQAVNEVLTERDRIDSIKHRDHHAFLEGLIEREKRRVEFWIKVKQQVVGWGIIVGLGSIGTAVYYYVTGQAPK